MGFDFLLIIITKISSHSSLKMPGKKTPASKTSKTSHMTPLEKANEARRNKPSKPSVPIHTKLNLIFPVGRYNRLIKQGRFTNRTSKSAGVFMAAVIEYITSEICELASSAASEKNKLTITPRHIQLALSNDEELNKLFCDAMISKGGVTPNVHAFLFGKQGKTGADAVTTGT